MKELENIKIKLQAATDFLKNDGLIEIWPDQASSLKEYIDLFLVGINYFKKQDIKVGGLITFLMDDSKLVSFVNPDFHIQIFKTLPEFHYININLFIESAYKNHVYEVSKRHINIENLDHEYVIYEILYKMNSYDELYNHIIQVSYNVPQINF